MNNNTQAILQRDSLERSIARLKVDPAVKQVMDEIRKIIDHAPVYRKNGKQEIDPHSLLKINALVELKDNYIKKEYPGIQIRRKQD